MPLLQLTATQSSSFISQNSPRNPRLHKQTKEVPLSNLRMKYVSGFQRENNRIRSLTSSIVAIYTLAVVDIDFAEFSSETSVTVARESVNPIYTSSTVAINVDAIVDVFFAENSLKSLRANAFKSVLFRLLSKDSSDILPIRSSQTAPLAQMTSLQSSMLISQNRPSYPEKQAHV